MKKITILLFATLFLSQAKSQNLIRNGGFETYETIPNQENQVALATPWEPVASTPEFYYIGSYFTITNATGNGYAGMIFFDDSPDSRAFEALGQPLDQALEAGKNYFLQFAASQSLTHSSSCLTLEIYGFQNAPQGNLPPTAHLKEDATAILLGEIEITSTAQVFRDYELCISPSTDINYFVISTPESECSSYVHLDNFELYEVNDGRLFEPELSLCDGDSILLGVDVSYAEYMWQDGSTDALYLITEPGLYYLAIDTVCSTGLTDTITVVNSGLGVPENFLGPDRTICNGDSLEIVLPNRTDETLIFLNGSEIDRLPPITREGDFYVRIENIGCIYEDQVSISQFECNECFVSFPNAFSPNSDGINDSFTLDSNCNFLSASLTIFDRWGNKVSHSEGSSIGWDSIQDQTEQGVFVYVFSYKVEERGEVIEKRVWGDVTVFP